MGSGLEHFWTDSRANPLLAKEPQFRANAGIVLGSAVNSSATPRSFEEGRNEAAK